MHQGIIEPVNVNDPSGDEPVTHYLSHHAVIRQDRTATKVHIVYDGSAKSDKHDFAINDFLYTGPNFIPKLFDILVKFRSYPIALTADIEKAFLMIGIAPEDRDKLRFLWLRDPFNLESYFIQFRFTKLMFGLRSSPAILGSVISHHVSKYKSADQANINTIQDSLYVDDLVCGANMIEKAFKIYRTCKTALSEGGFNLRKWNSNSAELLQRIRIAESVLGDRSTQPQNNPATIVEEEESYTKAMTGNCDNTEYTKLLGIIWDSDQDEFLFSFSELIQYASYFLPASDHYSNLQPKSLIPWDFSVHLSYVLSCFFDHCAMALVPGMNLWRVIL